MSGMKTAALLAGLGALFLLVGGALGGQAGLVMAFVFAVATNGLRTGSLTGSSCACITRRK
jgi:hypothetical protein